MSNNEGARAAAVNELKAIYQALFNDVVQAEDLFASTPSDFASRNHIRAYFAYVEGVAYTLKQVTAVSLDGTGVLTDKEMDKLTDRKRITLPCGKVEFKQSFMEMGESLRFTLKCYPKGHGINNYEPELGGGWHSMLASIKVRNRVTHPKCVADLTLSRADIAQIDAARQWWHESVQAMLGACEQEDVRLRQQNS